MHIGDIIKWNGKEYIVIKFQPEGIRLRGTKNNPLGERFEIVLTEDEIKMPIDKILKNFEQGIKDGKAATAKANIVKSLKSSQGMIRLTIWGNIIFGSLNTVLSLRLNGDGLLLKLLKAKI